MGHPREVLRRVPRSPRHRPAPPRRGVSLRAVPTVDGRRQGRPGHQEGDRRHRHRHRKEVIAPFFQWKHNGTPAGNGWNRSTNNAQWGVDYFDRTGTAKSNMFDNKPNETQYFYTDFDSTGEPLDGNQTYSVTFPKGQTPPVDGFWSLTLYNDKHLFHPNDLKRYSLGTKNKSLKFNDDGSLTLYAGAKSPGTGKESNWLPAPGGPFSLYIRAYWGQQPILDGSWKPPTIERAH